MIGIAANSIVPRQSDEKICEAAMSKIKLDQEEQGILDAFDADEFESVITDDRRSYLVQAAEETFKKGKLSRVGNVFLPTDFVRFRVGKR